MTIKRKIKKCMPIILRIVILSVLIGGAVYYIWASLHQQSLFSYAPKLQEEQRYDVVIRDEMRK